MCVLTCVYWHMCVLTCVCINICATWVINKCLAVSASECLMRLLSYMTPLKSICATWRIHMWDVTASYMRHDSFICDITHSCVTRLIYLWDVTDSYMRHDSFMSAFSQSSHWSCSQPSSPQPCSPQPYSLSRFHLSGVPWLMHSWHEYFIWGVFNQ